MHLLRVIFLRHLGRLRCLEVGEKTTVTRKAKMVSSLQFVRMIGKKRKLTGHRPCFRMLQSLLGTCRTDLHHPGHP